MRKSKEDTLETKQKLIDSTLDIVLQKGYANTTLNDIVSNIGLTRGAFYWHFKTKKDVLDVIVKDYESNYLRDYEQVTVYPLAYDTIVCVLQHQIDKMFSHCYMQIAYIIRYKIEAVTELGDLVDKQRKIDQLGTFVFKTQLERGVESGEFSKSLDCEVMALHIFSCIVGIENMVMLYYNQENEKAPTPNIEKLIEYILKPLP